MPCTYYKDTLSANMTNSISFVKTDLIWRQCPVQSYFSMCSTLANDLKTKAITLICLMLPWDIVCG